VSGTCAGEDAQGAAIDLTKAGIAFTVVFVIDGFFLGPGLVVLVTVVVVDGLGFPLVVVIFTLRPFFVVVLVVLDVVILDIRYESFSYWTEAVVNASL